MKFLTLALAAMLVAAPGESTAEPRLIGWFDLRPAGDFDCGPARLGRAAGLFCFAMLVQDPHDLVFFGELSLL